MARTGDDTRRTRPNRRLGLAFLVVAVAMVGASFAAVPLYRMFCQLTGYGGTPRIAAAGEAAPVEAARTVTVRFNTDVAPGLPWRFVPEQGAMVLHLGEGGLATFRARNLTGRPVSGQAIYNVTPAKAARYFVKTQCFCFSRQTLGPGQAVDMPVSFYVDPRLGMDPDTSEVHTITLSYTFFQAKESAP